MLLAREKKIVTLLIEHEDKLTTTQIATSLKVSSRTIKADIKKINEELEKEKRERNPEMFDYMMDLLMECDRKFYLQLEEDDELINALMDHLECMVLRLHSKSNV